MTSIIFATVPVHGHVSPLLHVARYFAERGDSVRFITGARFADAVAATGAGTSRCRRRRTGMTARSGTRTSPNAPS